MKSLTKKTLNKKKKLKAVFWGYHNSGKITFLELLKNNVQMDFIIVPYKKDTTGIKKLAGRNNISVIVPREVKNNSKLLNKIVKYSPDIFIVDSYDRLIPSAYLRVPGIGCFNFHESLLPRYRGPHVMNWAIINGEKQTGLTVHTMTAKFDEGDIVIQKKVGITNSDDINTVYKKICGLIPAVVRELVDGLEQNKLKFKKQDSSKASHCKKRIPEDGRINWNNTAQQVYNLIRALKKPWPNAFTYYKRKKLLINDTMPIFTKCSNKTRAGEVVKPKQYKYPLVVCGDGYLLKIREAGFKSSKVSFNKILKNGAVFNT